jgi:hypothetical protein
MALGFTIPEPGTAIPKPGITIPRSRIAFPDTRATVPAFASFTASREPSGPPTTLFARRRSGCKGPKRLTLSAYRGFISSQEDTKVAEKNPDLPPRSAEFVDCGANSPLPNRFTSAARATQGRRDDGA